MGGAGNSVEVDVAIALDHLSLAAVAEGLGTCWIGAFNEKQVKQALGIPAEAKVVAMMPLGYPASAGLTRRWTRPGASPQSDIFRVDRWDSAPYLVPPRRFCRGAKPSEPPRRLAWRACSELAEGPRNADRHGARYGARLVRRGDPLRGLATPPARARMAVLLRHPHPCFAKASQGRPGPLPQGESPVLVVLFARFGHGGQELVGEFVGGDALGVGVEVGEEAVAQDRVWPRRGRRRRRR